MASVSNDSWYCLIENRPVGPMSAGQLRAAALNGQLRPETPVLQSGWPQWRQAAEVPGLFANTAPAAPSVALPPTLTPPSTTTAPPAAKSAPVAPASMPPAAVQPPAVQPPAVTAPPGPPAPPLATVAAGIPIVVGGADQSHRASQGVARKRKKDSSAGMVWGISGFLAFCVLAGVLALVMNNRSESRTERPVAKTPAKPVEEPKKDDSNWLPPPKREKVDDNPYGFPSMPEATSQEGQHQVFELPTPPTPRGRIDELVFAKWEELGIKPANLCSDGVFLRRAYLDLIGTLPTVEEAKAFLKDNSPGKRERLVDALLERPEYADYWAMRWCDVLRVKAEFPINLWPNAAQAYHRWIHHAMATNMPYDQFARELLTATGSNFRRGQANFFRAVQSNDPKSLAGAVALTFMGERADKWPAERLNGLAGFFAKVGFKPTREWKEEIIIFDPTKKVDPAFTPVFPDGTKVEIPWDRDPREVFADWLITSKNPWFARQIVNRLWFWVQGRGIVHEADDFRPDNPPSNPELLDYLADELVKADYDLKHVFRLILNSSTYQLSPIPKSDHSLAAAHFASYTVRRLDAEVIIDALNQITGTIENYSSIIPEPYTFIPETHRAVGLPDGSISSSFLELFGRPPRDTGLLSERTSRMTAGQRLHMLNSSHIRNKIRNGPGIKELLSKGDSRENLYLAILSRFPTDLDWGGGGGDQLAWTLINTTEFLFRH